MRLAIGRAVAALGLVVLGVATALPAAPAAFAAPGPLVQDPRPELELVSQTTTVVPGGTFEMRVEAGPIPPDGIIRMVLHDRVRSRSELTASTESIGLRRQLKVVEHPVAELPVGPDGSRRLTLSFDPADPEGTRIDAAGAYPLEVLGLDAGGTAVASLITHVLAEPPLDDESPPLAVGVLAHLDAPPSLQPDGDIVLDRDRLDEQRELAGALLAAPAVDATLAVAPEVLEALTTSDTGEDRDLLAAIERAAADRSLLGLSYVDVSTEALASSGLGDQISDEIDQGRLVLASVLGVDPDTSTWLAGPSLGGDGLAALESRGIRHAVVAADQVEPLSPGDLRLSLAQPFRLAPPGEPDDASAVDALAVDPRIVALLAQDWDNPAVLAHRLLAELTVLWLEQPAIDRAVVVPIDASVPPAAVRVLMQGLGQARLFQAAGLPELFDLADPLVDDEGERVVRALDPQEPSEIGPPHARRVTEARSLLGTLRGMLGPDSARLDPVVDHLLLATAAALDRDEQEAHIDAAVASVDAVTEAVSVSDRATITLTAREGTVPLTVQNDSGVPVNVVIHARSSKLDFPDGETIALTLTDPVTRLDLEVRTRASGAFPLDVEVTSPDGRMVLGATRYTVQSTAISGAGLVLSIGAGLFLVVWWARHWRKTRRSAKLVAAHPSAHAARVGDDG